MESVVVPNYIQEAQKMIDEQERLKAATEEERRSREAQTQSTIPDNDIEMLDGDKPGDKPERPALEAPAKSPVPKVEHPSPPDGFPETAAESSTQARGNPTPAASQSTQVVSVVEPTSQPTLPAGVDPHEVVNSTSPWFYPPEHDEEARNFGIPAYEAEETRQLLLLAVQKEEEFIRGLERVRDMLLRADRMRKEVWDWCRADGAPEMSDGEDYVDLERWGLKEGDLLKGAEEEEEEDPKGKKTVRNSRRN
ncbi:hypothetical protein ABW19_dt0209916 [Dactylella cylindrospora]|nr:hypothetical protein ABW19_dt0209916 [Dactylella cylindrospora]